MKTTNYLAGLAAITMTFTGVAAAQYQLMPMISQSLQALTMQHMATLCIS